MGVKWGKRILVRVCPPPARSGDRCVFEDNGVFSKRIVWFSGLQRHFAGENALFSFEIGVFFGEKMRDFQLKLAIFDENTGVFPGYYPRPGFSGGALSICLVWGFTARGFVWDRAALPSYAGSTERALALMPQCACAIFWAAPGLRRSAHALSTRRYCSCVGFASSLRLRDHRARSATASLPGRRFRARRLRYLTAHVLTLQRYCACVRVCPSFRAPIFGYATIHGAVRSRRRACDGRR